MLKFRVYHAWSDIVSSTEACRILRKSGVELDDWSGDSSVSGLYRDGLKKYNNVEFAQALVLAAVICPRLEIGGLANVVLPDVDSLDLECGFTLHVRERIDLFRFRFESLIELIVDNLGSSSENNDLLGTEEVEDMGDKVMSAWSMITPMR